MLFTQVCYRDYYGIYKLEFAGEKHMKIAEIINDRSIKKIDKRKIIIAGLLNGDYSMNEIVEASGEIEEQKNSTILESIEEISNKGLMEMSVDYLEYAKRFISNEDSSCKREASRIVGNLAGQYPQAVQDAIPLLLENARADGTVVRWGSAYALSKIIVLDEYRNSGLYKTLVSICEHERENGVKNLYVKAFKKIKR